jgi:hypothetical protein
LHERADFYGRFIGEAPQAVSALHANPAKALFKNTFEINNIRKRDVTMSY